MKLRQVPIEQVLVPQVRVTAVYDEGQLELLRESLKVMGTVQPIIVVQTEAGFEVVDGLHRLEEARSRGEKTISAVVYEGGPQDTLLMNLVLNRLRGKTKASEMVAVIKTLWKDHGMDSDTIAARTGLTRDYIEKLQVISQASPGVQAALDQEVIGIGHAYEIARLPRHAQQEEVIAQFQVWRWTIKQLKEQVDMVLQQMEAIGAGTPEGAPREKPAPPKILCQACQEDTPPEHLRSVILCPECFSEVYRKGRARVPPPVPVKGEPLTP